LYAVDRGARIINLSIGTQGDSQIVRDAIDYALQHGVVIVAAAGNDGTESILFPACYEKVICVGAVDAEMNHAPFSNRGGTLDVVAPGVAVYTAAPGKRYVSFSGTSAAAPFVSGALAALLTENPYMSPDEIRQRLVGNADNLGTANRDNMFGEGMVNLKRALRKPGDAVYDAALTTLYFDPPELKPGLPVTVHYVIENQGTRTIRGAKFVSSIAGNRSETDVNDLSVGECVDISRPWVVPEEMPERTPTIEGVFRISEVDGEPQDNGQCVILQRSQWM
jgi:subtilisin family serine protease